MQPFIGNDSESGDPIGRDLGSSRGDPPQTGQRSRQASDNDVSYRERPFSDLVDEDKHQLVARKIASSLLGGYRLVINDYDEAVAPCGLLLA